MTHKKWDRTVDTTNCIWLGDARQVEIITEEGDQTHAKRIWIYWDRSCVGIDVADMGDVLKALKMLGVINADAT